MSLIKGINEFGNLVVFDYNAVQKVKGVRGNYQVYTPGGWKYLHNVNKPALLDGFEARQNEPKTLRAAMLNDTTKRLRSRTGKPGYIKVFEGRPSR